jgi:GSH-dependent disulfide-bond oxidoreductase
MIDFYFNLGPNPMKVALLLEELELPYRLIPVDMLKGQQFDTHFSALNPNNKVPVIVDDGTTVFDSNAILLFLAEKHGRFLPADNEQARAALLSWLMFVASGIGPYSGQAVHFRHYAPGAQDYGIERYLFEARRHYGILDAHLADRPWILGDDYTIVDIATWGWARNITRVIGDDAPERFPRLAQFLDTINARPAAQRAIALRDAHNFKDQFDEEAKHALFRHLFPVDS